MRRGSVWFSPGPLSQEDLMSVILDESRKIEELSGDCLDHDFGRGNHDPRFLVLTVGYSYA